MHRLQQRKTASKTGDLSPITGYAVAGLLAVAAFGMAKRKKKELL